MPRIGNDTEPVSTQEWNGVNTQNQTALVRTMPEHGRLTHVGFWGSARNNPVNARVMVWDAADNILGQGPQFSMAVRPFAVGENDLHYYALETPVVVAAGAVIRFGLSRDPAGEHQFGRTASGSHLDDTATGSWPQSLSGAITDSNGEVGAYADYTTAIARVRRSGVWVVESVRANRAGVQTVAQRAAVRRSGAWVDSS